MRQRDTGQSNMLKVCHTTISISVPFSPFVYAPLNFLDVLSVSAAEADESTAAKDAMVAQVMDVGVTEEKAREALSTVVRIRK